MSTAGDQTDAQSYGCSVSADGRFIAFVSDSTTLFPGHEAVPDVYVRDRQTGVTELAAVSATGQDGNLESGGWGGVSISRDGRFVVFGSSSTNLVTGDHNNNRDVFIRDRLLMTTERVSVATDGTEGDAYSRSWPGARPSDDGRYVVFTSAADNLVPGDTNGVEDTFLRDRSAGTTVCVSVSSLGIEANDASSSPCLSADGRYVCFASTASNLIARDSNGAADIFVHDALTGTTELLSTSVWGDPATGASRNPTISADGRYVAFSSLAPDLVTSDTNGKEDVFVRDRLYGTTTLVSAASDGSPANANCFVPSISSDGRYIAFVATASNLVANDTNASDDAFIRDMSNGVIERVSVSSWGEQGNSTTTQVSVSDDGQCVAFSSAASNLVLGDTNSVPDIFVNEPAWSFVRVQGAVAFDSVVDSVTLPSSVLMRITVNGVLWAEKTVPLAADGSFSQLLPEGSVELSVKHAHWLRRTDSVGPLYGDVTGINFLLTNGDANGDNRVNLLDLAIVLGDFGSNDWMADLDCDGMVSIRDLSTILANYGMAGDK